MECKESIDIMLDVIYGEEIEPSVTYDFFQHLKECEACGGEFREMTETRSMIRDWVSEKEVPDVPEYVPDIRKPGFRLGGNWWGTVQKIAATLLIVVGGIAAAQAVGVIPGKQADIPEAQLTRLINDIVVERQSEGWRVIGQALISLKEDMDLQDREQAEVFYEDLTDMEERFLRIMEEERLNSREMTSQ